MIGNMLVGFVWYEIDNPMSKYHLLGQACDQAMP